MPLELVIVRCVDQSAPVLSNAFNPTRTNTVILLQDALEKIRCQWRRSTCLDQVTLDA